MWDGAAARRGRHGEPVGHLGVLPANEREEIIDPPVKNVVGLLVGQMRPANSWL